MVDLSGLKYHGGLSVVGIDPMLLYRGRVGVQVVPKWSGTIRTDIVIRVDFGGFESGDVSECIVCKIGGYTD